MSPEKVLLDNGDQHGSIWLGPDGTASWFVLDLQQPYIVTSFHVKNTLNAQHGDRWTTDFKVSLSQDKQSWQEASSGTLEKHLDLQVLSSSVTSPMRYVKFEMLGYGTSGGGLGFFQVMGTRPGSGEQLFSHHALVSSLGENH